MAPSWESLGRFELEVLRYVADHPGASASQVAAHFAEASGHARTTLLTVLQRLRGKGYLKRRTVKGVQRYTATVSLNHLFRRLVGQFVDDVLGGSVSPFVAYLSETSSLNDQEAKVLERLLKRLEAESGEDAS